MKLTSFTNFEKFLSPFTIPEDSLKLTGGQVGG